MTYRLLLLACLLYAKPAHADLYGFIDADGQIHLARTRLDDRYQLFQKAPPPGAVDSSDVLSDATTPGLGATQSFDELKPKPSLSQLYQLPSATARSIDPKLVAKYHALIARVARDFKLDVQLLHSIVTVESGYDAAAVSPKGALGLMQVIPATGERFGVAADELLKPQTNLRVGARYLKFLLEVFDNNLPLVIAAYNAGEGAVQKYRNRIPPYPETRDYVARVLANYEARGGDVFGRAQPMPGQRVRIIIAPPRPS